MAFGKSLLSPTVRISAPFIKVTIGNYTFGVYNTTESQPLDEQGFYKVVDIKYPKYVKSLQITKINGKVNQYTLNIEYPVRDEDDPNFFEKVFSKASSTRKIIFSYGDAAYPKFIYKEEEAVITKVTSRFAIETAVISYTVSAVSNAILGKSGNFNFIYSEPIKPSDKIKEIFRNNTTYGLQDLFTGMRVADLDKYIPGDDQTVQVTAKTNISPLDYITYLVSCMQPASNTKTNISPDIYLLTIHDGTDFEEDQNGTYFKISKASYLQEHSDAYEIDIGFNTKTAVTQFSIQDDDGYAMYYDYQGTLSDSEYNRRLGRNGEWEDVYAPNITSGTESFVTSPDQISWWTKITKYPIKANISIKGLLRPAILMTYIRLNVIFPGAGGTLNKKHISSGLYIVTQQQDTINESGYLTNLTLAKISG